MKVSFCVKAETGDEYLVSLLSGDDAFFATNDVASNIGNEIEIVEIDLDRISGNNPTTPHTLSLITEGIARHFSMNEKAILYYYCEDMSEVPKSTRKDDMWPQEYRSQLFSLMFQRYLLNHGVQDVIDVTLVIKQDFRPIFMHLISRKEHSHYIERFKAYIIDNYGK